MIGDTRQHTGHPRQDRRRETAPEPVPAPDGALEQLRRHGGNRAVTRLLARQPVGKLDLLNPYDEPGAAQAEEFRRGTLSVVRDPILEALRRSDSIRFMNLLRGLDAADRPLLEADAAFMAEILRVFHGVPRFTVLLLLRFGGQRPIWLRNFEVALSDRSAGRVKDLLRGFERLRDGTTVPGVGDVLDHVFRGTSDHAEVMRVYREGEVSRTEHGAATERSAHYDRLKPGDPITLITFTGDVNYVVTRTATEFRVIVRIRLVEDPAGGTGPFLTQAKIDEWRRGIEDNWNGRFRATNGTTTLNVHFVPIFSDQSPHHTVTVHRGSGRADEANFFERSNGLTAAHEFGHMIGNPDEYGLPGSDAEIPATSTLTADERARSSVEGLTGTAQPAKAGGHRLGGIMGDKVGGALPRHAWPPVNWYNRNAKPAAEADFRLVKIR